MRALRHAAERAVIMAEGYAYQLNDFPLASRSERPPVPVPGSSFNLEQAEKQMIERALRTHHFNISLAATELGLSRGALYRRMESMDFRRKFELGLAWRTLFLIAAVWLFTKSLEFANIRAGRVIAALIVFFAVASIWTFIRRTNLLVARFVEFRPVRRLFAAIFGPERRRFRHPRRHARSGAENASSATYPRVRRGALPVGHR